MVGRERIGGICVDSRLCSGDWIEWEENEGIVC